MAKLQDISEKEFHIKLERTNPENIQPIFVNDMIVSHSDNEFFLTFFIVEPPIALNEEQASAIEKVEAPARVKIAVTPDFVKRIVKALQTNIGSFEDSKEEK